jgi:hypothetical protein
MKSKKTAIPLTTSPIPPNAPTPVNVKGFYQ